jgi:hypothetical protein
VTHDLRDCSKAIGAATSRPPQPCSSFLHLPFFLFGLYPFGAQEWNLLQVPALPTCAQVKQHISPRLDTDSFWRGVFNMRAFVLQQ